MEGSEEEGLRPLEDEDGLEEVLGLPLAVIYKHSPLCWQSFRAMGEIRRFALETATVPVFVLDVIAARALSRRVAERVGVRHESPQALVVSNGEVVWHTSHGGVRFDDLRQAVSAAE